MIVVDASVVVAAQVSNGPDGIWAERILAQDDLLAPHLMPAEAANIIRRLELRREISSDVASLSHEDLLTLAVHLIPYEVFAARAWELRSNVTAYDAWYVAIAEAYQAPLATFDRRLSRAPGPRCEFLVPPVV